MTAPRLDLQIRRAYDPPSSDDGTRILIDRLWPRGLRKEDAHFDHWLKEIAPSPALRIWFGHDPGRFAEFSSRYTAELEALPEDAAALQILSRALRAGRVSWARRSSFGWIPSPRGSSLRRESCSVKDAPFFSSPLTWLM